MYKRYTTTDNRVHSFNKIVSLETLPCPEPDCIGVWIRHEGGVRYVTLRKDSPCPEIRFGPPNILKASRHAMQFQIDMQIMNLHSSLLRPALACFRHPPISVRILPAPPSLSARIWCGLLRLRTLAVSFPVDERPHRSAISARSSRVRIRPTRARHPACCCVDYRRRVVVAMSGLLSIPH